MSSIDATNTRKMNRRTCLGGIGLGSIALAGLLAEEDAAATPSRSPLEPKQPHFAPSAKNVIFLFMVGGVSHLETFDHKPLLKKYAGKSAVDLFSKRSSMVSIQRKTTRSPRLCSRSFRLSSTGSVGCGSARSFPT